VGYPLIITDGKNRRRKLKGVAESTSIFLTLVCLALHGVLENQKQPNE
jgi:hypothetical protein